MSVKVRAFAPATVANVCCGFDIFGFALERPGDEVLVSWNEQSSLAQVSSIEGDGGKLPLHPEENTASIAANALLKEVGEKKGVSIELKKQMPLCSGLGSSAASAVATLVAVNELLGNPFTKQELLPFALKAEKGACGTAHADNAAPSLLGGFVLLRGNNPVETISIPVPKDLFCIVLHPNLEIKTEKARACLEKSVSMESSIFQSGNAAGLIAALWKGDFQLLGRCLQDVIVEPQRASLIPGFFSVKKAALESGALGMGISGSGPSLFALLEGKGKEKFVAKSMQDAWKKEGTTSTCYCSSLNLSGACVYEVV